MNTLGRFLAVGFLLAAISGCADTSQLLVHDLVVLWNEVCDNMLKATDEETAKKLLEVQFKVLEKKYDSVKARCEKKFMNFEKDDAIDLEDTLMDFRIEIEAVEKRLQNAKERVEKIIAAAPDPDKTVNLKKIASWVDTKARFNTINYGSFTPNVQVADFKEITPKQVGFKLMPAQAKFQEKDGQGQGKG